MSSPSVGTSTIDISKLTLAAEELVKAVLSHVETTPIDLSQDTIKELKELVPVSPSSLETKLDAVNSKLSNLENQLSEISTLMKQCLENVNKNSVRQMKYQSFDSAFANADFGSFRYFLVEGDYQGYVDSSFLVKRIVSSFRMDCGYNITRCEALGLPGKDTTVEDMKAQFRVEIVEQLYKLLGTKPRLASEEEECVIYYE